MEPFQGAATGVGGILRDIFAIGARPIAVLDSLRFGEPSSPRSRYLLERAVAGIGHYGNSVGVATVGGEVYHEGPYEQNCLVNAMALGLASQERMIRSAAAGVGNVVVLFGSSTGRDGIGGASVLASAELGIDEDKRPTVQVGDPFAGKKALECSLELLERGLLVSLQDLGAAGLTSSSAEMASKGERGPRPRRREGPAPRGGHGALRDHGQRVAGAHALRLRAGQGRRGARRLRDSGRSTARRSASSPTRGGCACCGASGSWATCRSPRSSTTARSTTSSPRLPRSPLYAAPEATLAADADARATLLALLASPNIASRLPLFQQYDWIVQSRTVRRPGDADAAVLRLPGGNAIAVAIDGSGRRVAADPYNGTIENVARVRGEPRVRRGRAARPRRTA